MARFEFNDAAVYSRLEALALQGVRLATLDATERVRKHAPVRKIFAGTTYHTGKSGFREPRLRRVVLDDESMIGHSNSITPVFRNRVGKVKVYTSGDFRRINPRTGALAKIGTGNQESTIGEGGAQAFGRFKASQHGIEGSRRHGELTQFTKTRGGKIQKVAPSSLKPTSADAIRSFGKPVVTARGRYEIRSGRANFRPPRDALDGSPASSRRVQVGGRLRAGIHSEGPDIEGNMIWGHVVSDTKDPETGRLYPRDQEFGTRHHPPHPFMRPGLQESRGSLRRFVRESIRRGLR